MDDFAAFSSAPSNNNNIEDFDRATSAFPDISLDGDFPSRITSPPTLNSGSAAPGSYSFDEYEAPAVKVTGDDDIGKFEDQFPDIDVPTSLPELHQQQTAVPSFGLRGGSQQQMTYSSTSMFTQPIEEEEPQVIKEWREKQAEEIRARDEASQVKRQETISKAERAIDEFYEDYSKKKERTIRENKNDEEEYQDKVTASLTAGTTWERITELIELQNSQSKSKARAGPGTTDLTRFKEVLLRLKREGNNAPGAAGY